MNTFEIIILIICAADLMLLAAVLIMLLKKGGSSAGADDIKQQTGQLKEYYDGGSKVILDQMQRQNTAISDAVKQNVELLGGRIESEQKNMRESTSASIKVMGEDLTGMRRENKEGIDNIKSIVTEKMQTILGEQNANIIKSISELGKRISDEQEKQNRMMTERLQKVEDELGKIRTEITASLTEINKTNAESMTKMMNENRESLDKINGTVNEKLQESLDKRINESFKTVSEQLMNVSKGLGEMQNVAVNITDLKKVLSNVKTRGNFGEVQLESILEEILSPDQYEKQANVTGNGANRVDFAIKLPGADGGEPVYLPIDAKFPGDTYSALVDAINSGNAEEADERRKRLFATIKDEAKSIHEKYIYPPHTTDFALMFLPAEGLYSEVVNTAGLVEELQRRYRVNVTGPSTMAAMLSSLRMGFQTLRIQQKSVEIQKVLEAAKKEFGNFGTALKTTRDRLRKVDEDLEKLVTTRSNAINRALKTITETDSLDTAQEIIDSN